MNVSDWMTKGATTCQADATLSDAARSLWNQDCGFLPVVDHAGALVGVLTDRDACMGAYTQGRELEKIPVSASMSAPVQTCRPDDSAESALALMARHQIRRLPVIDSAGRVVGVFSLNDAARGVAGLPAKEKNRRALGDALLETLAGVCRHREPEVARAPIAAATAKAAPAPALPAPAAAKALPAPAKAQPPPVKPTPAIVRPAPASTKPATATAKPPEGPRPSGPTRI